MKTTLGVNWYILKLSFFKEFCTETGTDVIFVSMIASSIIATRFLAFINSNWHDSVFNSLINDLIPCKYHETAVETNMYHTIWSIIRNSIASTWAAVKSVLSKWVQSTTIIFGLFVWSKDDNSAMILCRI